LAGISARLAVQIILAISTQTLWYRAAVCFENFWLFRMQQKCVVGNDRKEKQNTPNSSIGIHQATYLKRSKAEQVFDVC
jgi:hypothetical protein